MLWLVWVKPKVGLTDDQPCKLWKIIKGRLCASHRIMSKFRLCIWVDAKGRKAPFCTDNLAKRNGCVKQRIHLLLWPNICHYHTSYKMPLIHCNVRMKQETICFSCWWGKCVRSHRTVAQVSHVAGIAKQLSKHIRCGFLSALQHPHCLVTAACKNTH